MTNYIVSDTVAFNKELLRLICSDEQDNDDDDTLCLITGLPLLGNHVQLACGHKFNYVPIYKEICSQKRHQTLEVAKLGTHEVKCPYCRRIQNGLLPFDQEYGHKRYGVNHPPSKVYRGNKCQALLKSGKRKGAACAKACIKQFCKLHHTQTLQVKCSAILKSGKRKGELCNCRCIGKESIVKETCRRHLRHKGNKK